jgi:hypothetical protein
LLPLVVLVDEDEPILMVNLMMVEHDEPVDDA